MGYYAPDSAVVIKITHNNDTHYRVFGGWLGGYTNGSSWRVNSGVAKVEYDKDYYYFHGESGSVYKCKKGEPYFDSYLSGVLNNLCDGVISQGGQVEIYELDDDLSKKMDGVEFDNLDDVEV